MTQTTRLTDEQFNQWIEALESGKYKKGEGALKYDDEYCCLGVLAELHNILVKSNVSESSYIIKDKCVLVGFLPDGWFGLQTYSQENISNCNDQFNTFKPVIKYLKELRTKGEI